MPSRRSSVAPLAALAVGAGLAACTDLSQAMRLSPGGVDPRSPVAPQATAAAARNYKYPKFRDVPPKPTDVRPASAWKAAVIDMVGQRRGLKGWAAANPPMTDDTAAYVAAGRAAFPPEATAPFDSQSETAEAYAARLRGQASAPFVPQAETAEAYAARRRAQAAQPPPQTAPQSAPQPAPK